MTDLTHVFSHKRKHAKFMFKAFEEIVWLGDQQTEDGFNMLFLNGLYMFLFVLEASVGVFYMC